MTDTKEFFRIFRTIITSIQSSSEQTEILRLIVENGASALHAKACSLFLVRSRSDADGLFHPAAQVGLSESYIHTGPARRRNITAEIIDKGGFLAVKDATTDPRVENHDIKKREGIASMLVVPVIAAGEPLGILALYTAEPRDFSSDEIDFLRGLADHGGLAILRARNEYRIKREFELLASVSENLNSSLDIRKVLHIMTADITHTFDLLGVTIRLVNEASKELQLVASYGLSERYLNKGPVRSDRIATVLKHGKHEWIDDINDGSIDYVEERRKEGIASMLHLPITVKGSAIGLMGLYSDKKRVMTDDTINLMSSIARQCGLAIHNASLYLQLQQDKKELEEEIWGHKAWF